MLFTPHNNGLFTKQNGGIYGNKGELTNELNEILDDNEKTKSVTTSKSGSSSRYDGIRKGWLVDGLVEIELGMMQNEGQWDAYIKGSLRPVRS